MLIIGISASIAVVNLDKFIPSLKMDSSARQLAGLISYLYDTSISTGKVYGIKYNAKENYYEVRLIWNEVADKGEAVPEEAQILSGRTYLPEGVTFKEIKDDFGQSVPQSSEKMDVRFDPCGFITPHRIHLADTKGREITLEVLFLSGQVVFHEGFFEPRETLERISPVQ